jgi:hypothetical protein
MKLSWVSFGALFLACCLPARIAGARDRQMPPCSATISSPAGVDLRLTLKEGRFVYHEGEIIRLSWRLPALRGKSTSLALPRMTTADG